MRLRRKCVRKTVKLRDRLLCVFSLKVVRIYRISENVTFWLSASCFNLFKGIRNKFGVLRPRPRCSPFPLFLVPHFRLFWRGDDRLPAITAAGHFGWATLESVDDRPSCNSFVCCAHREFPFERPRLNLSSLLLDRSPPPTLTVTRASSRDRPLTTRPPAVLTAPPPSSPSAEAAAAFSSSSNSTSSWAAASAATAAATAAAASSASSSVPSSDSSSSSNSSSSSRVTTSSATSGGSSRCSSRCCSSSR